MELFAYRMVMGVKESVPFLVAQRRGLCSGADDVGKEHGGEDAIDFKDGSLSGEKLGDLVQQDVLGVHDEVPTRNLGKGRSVEGSIRGRNTWCPKATIQSSIGSRK